MIKSINPQERDPEWVRDSGWWSVVYRLPIRKR